MKRDVAQTIGGGTARAVSAVINGAPFVANGPRYYAKPNLAALGVLCTDCANILQKEYPGEGHFAWGCAPTADGSMINIKLIGDGLHGRYGWQVETESIQQETGRLQKLQAAGGEILERYNLDGKRTESKRIRDARGEVIPET